MKKVITLAVLLLFFSFATYAQNFEIRGTVTDKNTGEPLIAATVMINGTTQGAATDIDGRYTIKNIKPGTYELKCAYIAYNTQVKKITLSGESKIVTVDFKMEETTVETGEIVVFHSMPPIVKGDELHRASVSNNPTRAPVNMIGGAVAIDRSKEEYSIFNENKFISAADCPLSTFSVDVDRASYSIVRNYINEDEELPPADAVRIEEMLNYFSYSYPNPAKNEAVSITTDLTKCPWGNNLLLKVGLKSPPIDLENTPANNLVFLIDVSGSMQYANKLPLVKQSLSLLVAQMREQDRIAIVVYAGSTGQVLPSTPGSEKAKIMAVINNLEAGGSTAGGAGIQLAYKVAAENFLKKGNNRVILCTDGDFNVGVTNNEQLEQIITEKAKTGVYLTVLGFGIGNYKDNRMEMLADKGNGNYGYIDNLGEAKKLLVKEMGATLHTAANDVKLQLEFNPLLVKEYRLIGYENRLLADEDFNNDSVDAGDMGAGHTVTALYEIVPGVAVRAHTDSLKYQQTTVSQTAKTDELLTIKFRYKVPGKNKSKLLSATVKNIPSEFAAAHEDTRFAATVAGFGMLLRNSEYKGTLNFNTLVLLTNDALKNSTDEEKLDFLRLLRAAKELHDEEFEDEYAEGEE